MTKASGWMMLLCLFAGLIPITTSIHRKSARDIYDEVAFYDDAGGYDDYDYNYYLSLYQAYKKALEDVLRFEQEYDEYASADTAKSKKSAAAKPKRASSAETAEERSKKLKKACAAPGEVIEKPLPGLTPITYPGAAPLSIPDLLFLPTADPHYRISVVLNSLFRRAWVSEGAATKHLFDKAKKCAAEKTIFGICNEMLKLNGCKADVVGPETAITVLDPAYSGPKHHTAGQLSDKQYFRTFVFAQQFNLNFLGFIVPVRTEVERLVPRPLVPPAIDPYFISLRFQDGSAWHAVAIRTADNRVARAHLKVEYVAELMYKHVVFREGRFSVVTCKRPWMERSI